MRLGYKHISRIITNKQWSKDTAGLLFFYESLSPTQRLDIKQIFDKNKNYSYPHD